MCRIHCTVQIFWNFNGSCDTEFRYTSTTVYRRQTLISCNFFVLFEPWKYQKQRVEGINFQIHVLIYIGEIALGFKRFFITKYPLCSPMNDYMEIFEILKFLCSLIYILYINKYTYIHNSRVLISAMVFFFNSFRFSTYKDSKFLKNWQSLKVF